MRSICSKSGILNFVLGFSCEMLNLTTKHSQLPEIEPPAHFPKRVLVLYPSNVYTCAPQIGPFQPVHVDGKWNLRAHGCEVGYP